MVLSARLCTALLIVLASTSSIAAGESELARPTPPAPSPAFWKLESGGSTMYFLGSMHVLPLGFRWRTPIIEKAMAASDIFVFEVSMGGGSMRNGIAEIAGDYRLPKGETLSEKLSEQGKIDLNAIAKDLGINIKALDKFRPWAALNIIQSLALKHEKDGVAVSEYGVDERVAQFSEQNRKPRRYFEKAEFQMQLVTRMDEDGIESFEAKLREVLKTRIPTSFRKMAELYVTGNLDALMKEFHDTAGSPVFEKAMLEDRNKNWVDVIPGMLQQKRTFFVTVGAAHLWGEKSVIAMLCAKGFAPTKVDSVSGKATPACGAIRKSVQDIPATPPAGKRL